MVNPKLIKDSAVRTQEYQWKLQEHNGNATNRSSHIFGSTVDIAKKGMSRKSIQWMRHYLLRFEKMGLIEATEEFHQAVFHVMVFKAYENYRPVPAKKAGGQRKKPGI